MATQTIENNLPVALLTTSATAFVPRDCEIDESRFVSIVRWHRDESGEAIVERTKGDCVVTRRGDGSYLVTDAV